MSTPIWEEGKVAACLCAQQCNRCDRRGRCIQLYAVDRRTQVGSSIILCLDCWTALCIDALMVRMGEWERGYP